MFKNFDFSKIFDLKRIFEGKPGSQFEYYNEFILFFSLLLVLFLSVFIYRQFFVKNKVTKRFLKKVRKFLFSFSFWGFLWILLRWQKVYIFSSRAIFYIIIIVYLVRAFFLIRYYILSYSKEVEAFNKNQLLKKYIPKRKKKK